MEFENTIVVIDDDDSVRRSLVRLIRSAGYQVEQHESADEFLKADPMPTPGCLILDVHMPGTNGLELQTELNNRGVFTPIIFITGQGDIPMSVSAMKEGAIDFLSKPLDDTALFSAIETAIAKERELREEVTTAIEIKQRLGRLTPREREVLEQVITGKLNKQIADQLGTAVKTIKVHRGRMMQKMEVKSVAELVHIVEQVGIYPT